MCFPSSETFGNKSVPFSSLTGSPSTPRGDLFFFHPPGPPGNGGFGPFSLLVSSFVRSFSNLNPASDAVFLAISDILPPPFSSLDVRAVVLDFDQRLGFRYPSPCFPPPHLNLIHEIESREASSFAQAPRCFFVWIVSSPSLPEVVPPFFCDLYPEVFPLFFPPCFSNSFKIRSTMIFRPFSTPLFLFF